MPIVRVELFPGRSREQKARLAEALTQQFVNELGTAPADVTIVFQDTPSSDWFVAGQKLTSHRELKPDQIPD